MSTSRTVALFWASPTAAPTPLLEGSFSFLTEAHGINDARQIVGVGADGVGGAALFWANPNTSPTVLSVGGLDNVAARGINDAGQIVGYRDVAGEPWVALLWESPSASPTALPNGSMSFGWLAFGNNDSGQIVGRGSSSDFGLTAVVSASPTASPVALPAGGGLWANGINNAGRIVGPGPVIWFPQTTAPLFLHTQGGSLFLNTNAPTDATVDFRQASLNFAKGNVWKTVGTWADSPTGSSRALRGGDLRVWLGFPGQTFDLRAEVLRNGVPVASAQRHCIAGLTRSPAGASEVLLSFNAIEEAEFGPGDVLSLRVSARIGTDGNGLFCGGRKDAGVLRLYFDAVSRPAQFVTTFE